MQTEAQLLRHRCRVPSGVQSLSTCVQGVITW